jgi:hypothetical protein
MLLSVPALEVLLAEFVLLGGPGGHSLEAALFFDIFDACPGGPGGHSLEAALFFDTFEACPGGIAFDAALFVEPFVACGFAARAGDIATIAATESTIAKRPIVTMVRFIV